MPDAPQRRVSNDPNAVDGPDRNRPREFLEQFPLDTLRMVGTLADRRASFGLVQTTDGLVHRVAVGNHMGQNYGRIVAISDSEIQLVEIISDGLGGYLERPAAIGFGRLKRRGALGSEPYEYVSARSSREPLEVARPSSRASAGFSRSASCLRPRNAQDALRLEAIDVQPLAGATGRAAAALERHRSRADDASRSTIPARISLDLPNTTLALDSRRQDANVGPLTTVLAAEANGRTRVVMNLSSMVPYQTRVEGNSVYVLIGQAPGAGAAPAFAAQPSQGGAAAPRSAAAASGDRSIRNIDFRRGADGAGQVVVELNDPRTTVDVRQEGGRIVVDFQDTTLPQELMRRLDVTDFATPVFTVDALRANQDARLVVTAAADVRPGRLSIRQSVHPRAQAARRSRPLRRPACSTRIASTAASA